MNFIITIIFGLIYVISLPFVFINSTIAEMQSNQPPAVVLSISCADGLQWQLKSVPEKETGYSEGFKETSAYYSAELVLSNNSGDTLFDTTGEFTYPPASDNISDNDFLSGSYALQAIADNLPLSVTQKTEAAQCLEDNESQLVPKLNVENYPGNIMMRIKTNP